VLPANVRLDWKVISKYKHSSLFGLIVSNEEIKSDKIDTCFASNRRQKVSTKRSTSNSTTVGRSRGRGLPPSSLSRLFPGWGCLETVSNPPGRPDPRFRDETETGNVAGPSFFCSTKVIKLFFGCFYLLRFGAVS
jgi:hypothetical protein